MKINEIYEGNLIIKKGDKTDYSKFKKITGYVDVREGANFQAEALTSIGGGVDVYEGASFQAESLTSIGGYVDVREGASFQAESLTSIGGYVSVREGASFQAEALTSIGGGVDVYEGASFQADALTSIGSYVFLCEDASFQVDALTSIGGDVSVCEGASFQADALTSIGGYVDVREGASFQADALTSIGGDVSVYEGASFQASKNLKKNDENCPARYTRELALKFNFECFLKAGFLFADGILAKILEKKKNVYKIRICGQTKISYCIELDGQFAHGETIKEAKEDLKFKITDRDTSMYNDYTLDTVVTEAEAIQMYRKITGACQKGTKHFVNNVLKVKKNKYTVKEIIELTKGQYNSEVFKKFYERN